MQGRSKNKDEKMESSLAELLGEEGAKLLKSQVNTYKDFNATFSKTKGKWFDSAETTALKKAYEQYEKENDPAQKKIKARFLDVEIKAWIGNRNRKNLKKERPTEQDDRLLTVVALKEVLSEGVVKTIKKADAHAEAMAALKVERESTERAAAEKALEAAEKKAIEKAQLDERLKQFNLEHGIDPERIKLNDFQRLNLLFRPANPTGRTEPQVDKNTEKLQEEVPKKGFKPTD